MSLDFSQEYHMRCSDAITEDITKLRKSYRQLTCGYLRAVFRRYGDKQIYLIDDSGNEVHAKFFRIHELYYGYRWELHPSSVQGIRLHVEIGSCNCRQTSSAPIKYLSEELFGEWGGYSYVPVYICENEEGEYGGRPSFGDYTICGDRIVFRRNKDAYEQYHALFRELVNSECFESRIREKEAAERIKREGIQLPKVKGHKRWPALFDSLPDLRKKSPTNRCERRHPDPFPLTIDCEPNNGSISFARANDSKKRKYK